MYVGMVVWFVAMLGIVLSLFVYFISQYLHLITSAFAIFLLEIFLLNVYQIPIPSFIPCELAFIFFHFE